jgi:dTDP-4-amino-4,6-dideoxygalactose transaminase
VRGLTISLPGPETSHAFYRLYGSVDPSALAPGWDRDRLTRAISAEGTPVQYGGCAEVYREAAFANAGLGPSERLPCAARLHETSIAFFVHPTLTDADIDDTIEAVRKVMQVACV